MPPEVSPTPAPFEWPTVRTEKYQPCPESFALDSTSHEQPSNMASIFKIHQSFSSTGLTVSSSFKSASMKSQSSKSLVSDRSCTPIPPPLILPGCRGSNARAAALDQRRSRSPVCSERVPQNGTDVDVVLPQELYRKLFVTKPDYQSTAERTSAFSSVKQSSPCPFLLLDCRSTKAFKQKHIDGALNVNCANRIYCRRLRDGKISLADLVSSEEGKMVLKEPNRRTTEIIVYDEDTQGTDNLPISHPTLLVLSRLKKDGTRASLLKGGIQAFEQNYGDMCNTDHQNGNQTGLTTEFMSICVPPPPTLDTPGVENHPPPPPPCNSAALDAPMARILPYLYVGGEKDAADACALKESGITHILNATGRVPCFHEGNANFSYLRIPVRDNGTADLLAYFDQAFQFIEEARQNEGRVLVHCQAGISRSSTIAIGYIMKYLGLSMNQAYSKVQACRPIIAPNLSFVGQLAKYEKTLIQAKKQFEAVASIQGCSMQAHNSRPGTPITELDMLET